MVSPQIEPNWCRITSGDTAEATFRFTIDNFKNRPEKCRESVNSSLFNINGPGDLKTIWKFGVFPKGVDMDSEEYVGLYFNNYGNVKQKAGFKVDIMDGAGKERETFICNPTDFDICRTEGRGLGRKKWV